MLQVAVWRALVGEQDVRLAGLGARDSLRLEAGLCLYGNELTADITPIEAGLSWTVGKSRRGDGAAPFLGSDVILAQLKDRSLVKRLRCGLLPTVGRLQQSTDSPETLGEPRWCTRHTPHATRHKPQATSHTPARHKRARCACCVLRCARRLLSSHHSPRSLSFAR